MTLAPNRCLVCGKGNTPDGVTGKVGPFLSLGIDYNWGDSGYLCEECVGRAAVFFEWISPDTQSQLSRRIKDLEKKVHDLEGEIEMRRRRERGALKRARAVS
jgi:hypothetical protein